VRAEPGPLLFARYAYPPNRLGYCGPDDALSLADHVREGVVDPDLLRLERGFEGAYPYLALIARENGIADPLDRRVVEAYWIGNDLSDRIRPTAFAADLDARFGGRVARAERRWLLELPSRAATVHHDVHVLEVMPRIGMLRDGFVPGLLLAMGRCLVRAGRVEAVTEGGLQVAARSLELRDGRLALGRPVSETVVDGLGRATGDGAACRVRRGDWVALHWGVAVDRLEPGGAAALERIASRAVAAAAGTT